MCKVIIIFFLVRISKKETTKEKIDKNYANSLCLNADFQPQSLCKTEILIASRSHVLERRIFTDGGQSLIANVDFFT